MGTSLTRHAHLMKDPDPAGQRRAAKELFDKFGIVVIFPQDVAEQRIDNMWFEAIGRRLYGGKT